MKRQQKVGTSEYAKLHSHKAIQGILSYLVIVHKRTSFKPSCSYPSCPFHSLSFELFV